LRGAFAAALIAVAGLASAQTQTFPRPALAAAEIQRAVQAAPRIIDKLERANGDARGAYARFRQYLRATPALPARPANPPTPQDFARIALAASGFPGSRPGDIGNAIDVSGQQLFESGGLSAQELRTLAIACHTISMQVDDIVLCDGEDYFRDENDTVMLEYVNLSYLTRFTRWGWTPDNTESVRETLAQIYLEQGRTADFALITGLDAVAAAGRPRLPTEQERVAAITEVVRSTAQLQRSEWIDPYFSDEELNEGLRAVLPVLQQNAGDAASQQAHAALAALSSPAGAAGIAAFHALGRASIPEGPDGRGRTKVLAMYALAKANAAADPGLLYFTAAAAAQRGHAIIAESAYLDAIRELRRAGRFEGAGGERQAMRELADLYGADAWNRVQPMNAEESDETLPDEVLALVAETDPSVRRSRRARPDNPYGPPRPYSVAAAMDRSQAWGQEAGRNVDAFADRVEVAVSQGAITAREGAGAMMLGLMYASSRGENADAFGRIYARVQRLKQKATAEQLPRPVTHEEVARYWDPSTAERVMADLGSANAAAAEGQSYSLFLAGDWKAAEPLLRTALQALRADEDRTEDVLLYEGYLAQTLLAARKDTEALPLATRVFQAQSAALERSSGRSADERLSLAIEAARSGIVAAKAALRLNRVAEARSLVPRIAQALAAPEAGFSLMAEAGYTRNLAGQSFSLAAEWADVLAATQPDRSAESFRFSQIALQRLSAFTMENSFARLAISDPRTGALARQRADMGAIGASGAEGRAQALRAMQLSDQIRAADPRAAAFMEASFSTADVDGVARALGSGEALVVLTPSTDAILIGVITPARGLSVTRAPITEENLRALVQRLRSSMEAPPLISALTLKVVDLEAAQALYAATFGAITAQLDGVATVNVVAGGALQRVPMHALVTAPTASLGRAGAAHAESDDFSAYRRVPWLGDRLQFAYVPSLTAFQALRATAATPSGASRAFIGFGGPSNLAVATQAGTDSSVIFDLARSGGAGSVYDLPELPAAGASVREMGTQLGAGPADILVGDAMTEARLRELNANRALEHYRVLAFSTHGLYSGELPGIEAPEPMLVFTPPRRGAAASAQNDGLVLASDIAQLHLNAEWVLLLACNTAETNAPERVQPLSGLSQAFLYAGARALLVSHWRAGDEGTANLVRPGCRRRFEQGGASARRHALSARRGPRPASAPGRLGAILRRGRRALRFRQSSRAP